MKKLTKTNLKGYIFHELVTRTNSLIKMMKGKMAINSEAKLKVLLKLATLKELKDLGLKVSVKIFPCNQADYLEIIFLIYNNKFHLKNNPNKTISTDDYLTYSSISKQDSFGIFKLLVNQTPNKDLQDTISCNNYLVFRHAIRQDTLEALKLLIKNTPAKNLQKMIHATKDFAFRIIAKQKNYEKEAFMKFIDYRSQKYLKDNVNKKNDSKKFTLYLKPFLEFDFQVLAKYTKILNFKYKNLKERGSKEKNLLKNSLVLNRETNSEEDKVVENEFIIIKKFYIAPEILIKILSYIVGGSDNSIEKILKMYSYISKQKNFNLSDSPYYKIVSDQYDNFCKEGTEKNIDILGLNLEMVEFDLT